MATAATTKPELPVPVLERPHWRVVVRPNEFDAERIPSLADCWSTVERSRVALRGWDYPHIDHENQAGGEDWIASWIHWGLYIEYWRLFQSGQFVHLFGFREDHPEVRATAQSTIDRVMTRARSPFEPTGHLEFIGALYSITEVFTFASRLALANTLDDGPHITIGMDGIQDRLLLSTEFRRHWSGCYRATERKLERTWSPSRIDLIGNAAGLAIDATLWFFERFGWKEPPRRLLEIEQREFLERRAFR